MKEMNKTSTISSILTEAFKNHSEKTSIMPGEGFSGMTYGELYDMACRVASLLAENGVEPGKGIRVAISMSRSPAYVVSFAACLLFGYAAVLLDPDYPEDRKNYILSKAAPRFVLTEASYYLAKECTPARLKIAPAGETDAVIVYTSGSTGNPKGIIHSQASCGSAVYRLLDVIGLTPQDHYGVAARFTFAVHCSDLLLPLASGCAVTLVPLNVVRDPQMLALFCKTHQITATFMPPSLFRTFERASDTLKTVVVSGEKVFNIDPKGMRVIATYGMSEAYVMMAEEVRECSEHAYIGKPIGDICAYVLDENGQEVEEGELCVTGVFLTGYTEYQGTQVPAENPFMDRDGHRWLLHTHDCVRKLPDGRYEYIDRMDWMVKINGNRVELGEVENILRRLPEIRDVIASGYTDAQGRVFLCAYYIQQPECEVSVQYLKDKLAEKVPAYMIPPFFIRLDEFPKNANGKLDRKALSRPDLSRFQKEYVPPRDEIEAKICRTMEQVLGVDPVGVNDDFFDLGGDSLKSAYMLSELGDEGLTYSMIYDGRTPGGIAELVRQAGMETRTLRRAMEERNRPQPLLPYQTYYLDYQMYSPGRIIMNCPLYCRIPAGKVDPEQLKSALMKVLHHFAVFGTIFTFDSSVELVQQFVPELIPDIGISYVSEEAFEKSVRPGFIRPFRLFNSLLWRGGIFVTPENTYILIDMHHAVTDRAMAGNLFRNVFNALAGKPLDDDDYYLYLHEQALQRMNATVHAREALQYLKEFRAYSGFPIPDFESNKNEQGAVWTETGKTLGELERFAQENRVSLQNLLTAAGAAALGKYNHARRVGVRWTYNGRDEAWKEPLMGMLLSGIPANIDLDACDTGEKLLQEVKRQAMLGIRYSAVSAAFSEFSPGQTERLSIVYQHGADGPDNLPEGAQTGEYFEYFTGTLTLFELIVFEQGADQPLRIKAVFNHARYREESAKSFAELFVREVDRGCRMP